MSAQSLALSLKLVVLSAWFVAAAGMLFPDTSVFGLLGRGLFVLLAVVHAVECAVFLKTLKRTGRPLALELLQTMLFGVVHFAEAKAIVDAREEGDAT